MKILGGEKLEDYKSMGGTKFWNLSGGTRFLTQIFSGKKNLGGNYDKPLGLYAEFYGIRYPVVSKTDEVVKSRDFTSDASVFVNLN